MRRRRRRNERKREEGRKKENRILMGKPEGKRPLGRSRRS
jgi:hypothetical protein